MSWQACAWADSLEYDVVGPLAFRVLLKLANVSNEDGTIAFRTKATMAHELGVNVKSIQRALNELQSAALIKPGDQSFVRHLTGGRRPVVYELNFRYKTQYEQPELPWPVDNPAPVGGHGYPQVGHAAVPPGGTAGVPHRTIIKATSKSSSRTLAVADARESVITSRPCSNRQGHRWPSARAASTFPGGLVPCLNGCGVEVSMLLLMGRRNAS